MKDTPHPRPDGPEAQLIFAPGSYQIVRPGAFVTCAVTGAPIPLRDLRYWSAEHQEAYTDAHAASRAYLRHTGKA